MARTLLVGLDGASPHLIHRWRESLPHLNALIQSGASGTLQSVIPPRSIPAWYCFITGMNPAKIGVFGFSQRLPGTYDYTFANLTHCQAPTFWDRINGHGLRTAIVHVPGTFPPRPLNGRMVAGWPAPQNRGQLTYTHPAALSREIDRHLGQPFEFLSPLPMQLDNDADVLADRLRILEMHGEVACRLLDRSAWEAALVVLSPLDRASHQFWRHMDPTHPGHEPEEAKRFGDALLQVYRASDAQLGRLLSLLRPEDTVFVVSDHGFGPARRKFYLNEWLRQRGYLTLQPRADDGSPTWRTRMVGRLTQPLYQLNESSPTFRRLVDPLKKGRLSNWLRDRYVQTTKEGLVRINHLPVDWSRTRAYCPDEASLYLNLAGRDPEGIVQPGAEAQRFLQTLQEELSALHDPVTGERVDVRCHPKEAMYRGPYLDEAPDLVLEMDGYATEVMAEMGDGTLFRPPGARSGTHSLDGVLIAHGPDIDPKTDLHAGLMDVVPTVLHLIGLPVPEEMDGRVLIELFREDSPPRRRPVERQSAGDSPGGEEQAYSEGERLQIEEQLRDLGYLG